MGGANAGSGGTPAAGAGGGGNTGDFHPCPTNGDACKILPLGDSITWGIQYDGAYRVELFTKAVADNHKITFTGSLSNGPSMVAGQTFPKANEGHSGWTIDQDAGLIPSPALMTIPHIVLVHIGTNDIYASSGQSTMPDRLGKLIDKVIAGAPDALVVVAKITPLSNSSWNATIKTYNDAIPGVIKTRADAGKHVIGADMNTGFTSGMLSSDGVHPQKSGYDFMGDQFYSVIEGYLP
jgi:lysophospholipase L1-like esterase